MGVRVSNNPSGIRYEVKPREQGSTLRVMLARCLLASLYLFHYEHPKSRRYVGADVASDRTALLQSLQARSLSRQDPVPRGLVALHRLRRIRPLQLSRQRQSIIPQGAAASMQNLSRSQRGHPLVFGDQG